MTERCWCGSGLAGEHANGVHGHFKGGVRHWYPYTQQDADSRRAARDEGCTCWNLPAGVHAPRCPLFVEPRGDTSASEGGGSTSPAADTGLSQVPGGANGSDPNGSRESEPGGVQVPPAPPGAGDLSREEVVEETMRIVEKLVGHMLNDKDRRRLRDTLEREEDHAEERHQETLWDGA